MYDNLIHVPDMVYLGGPGSAYITPPGSAPISPPGASTAVYPIPQDHAMYVLPQSYSAVYVLPERTGGTVLNTFV